MQSDAELPEHNTRNFLWIILGLTVVGFGCIACCGAGAWLAVERIGDIPGLSDFADAELPPPVVESAAEKRAWVKAAFADPRPAEQFDRRSLDVFFQRVVEASQADDDAPFQRLIDGERLWRTIKERGLIQQISRGDDRSMPEAFRTAVSCPGVFERFHVQAVTPGRFPNEAVAYVFLWENGWISEHRWWLVRDGRAWKAFDWESLQVGVRQSLRYAAFMAELPGVSRYDDLSDAILKSNELFAAGDVVAAIERIREAERQQVPDMFRANQKLDVAFAWARVDRALYEMELYETSPPDILESAPGLLLGWAMEAYEQDEFESALQLIERYEREVGGGPNVEKTRADSLLALGRTSEAAAHYLQLMKYSPDDISLQSRAARYLPPERLDTIVKLLKQRPDPAQATYEAAAYVAGEPVVLRAYEALLTELEPRSPKLGIVRGMRLQAEGQIDAAADAFLALYEQAKQSATTASDSVPDDAGDGANQVPKTSVSDDALSYFHELFWEADRPLEAYDRSPEKQTTFEYLVYQADEYEMSAERRQALVEQHSKTAPSDPLLLVQRAQAATEEENHAVAADLWKQVIEADEQYTYYLFSLAKALIELGRLDDAVALAREYPDDMVLLHTMRDGLRKSERYEELLAIAELPRGEELQTNQVIAFAKADALAGLERFDEAEAVLKAQSERTTDDWQRKAICREWLKVAEQAGWSQIRYLDLAGRESMPILIDACQEQDGKHLERLVADWHARGGSPEVILPAQVELLARRQDSEAIVRLVMATGGPAALASTHDSQPLLHYVRSLLRTNRVDQALDAARAFYDATGDASQLIIAQMLHSDWKAAKKSAAVAAGYARTNLYLDDVALPLLRTDEAADFRARFPRGSGALARTLAVVLLPEPLPGTREEQLEHLRRAAGEITSAVVDPFESSGGKQLFLHDGDQTNWLIASGSDPYFGPGAESLVESDELRALLKSQRGWVAVDWTGGRSSDSDSAWRDLGGVLSKVAPSNASLLLLESSYGQLLCPFSPQLLEQMQTKGFAWTDIENRESTDLYREVETRPRTRLSQTFPKFAAAFATRQQGDSFTVDAGLSLPHGEVPVTLAVERVVLRPYTLELVVNADGVPEPLQRLLPGNRLQLDGWSLTGWTYTKDGKTVSSDDILAGNQEPNGADTK